MNCTHAAAALAALPAHLLLPIEAPRADWPGFIEEAATRLASLPGSQALCLELRAIAEALRAEELA